MRLRIYKEKEEEDKEKIVFLRLKEWKNSEGEVSIMLDTVDEDGKELYGILSINKKGLHRFRFNYSGVKVDNVGRIALVD